MPEKEFLETYPLYRKRHAYLGPYLNNLKKPAIHMHCRQCKSPQTFNMVNEYPHLLGLLADAAVKGKTVSAIYRCSSCRAELRFFFLYFDSDDKDGKESQYVIKVGQYPPWEISVPPALAASLGDHVELYKKALTCESQAYGIGAFAYYRRVVEEIIDKLLDDISSLMAGEDQERYIAALEQTRKTKVTQKKIELVKELLPPILRPDNLNPLAVLHDDLSEGLHSETDEECMERAARIRNVLGFLVTQVTASKSASKAFTEDVRKLLEKKA